MFSHCNKCLNLCKLLNKYQKSFTVIDSVTTAHYLLGKTNGILKPTTTTTTTTIKRQISDVHGDIISPLIVSGKDYLHTARLNKGLAFTLEERQALGIHGLQPAAFRTQEEQVASVKIVAERFRKPLDKYMYIMDLQDRNERLFFRVLNEDIEEWMPIVYTPTVGLACQKFGLIYRRPRGLFITINDRGHVFDILKNWPEPDVRAICITDGERILGLGDLGAHGMGIPVGKLSLVTALAGVPPHQCLPILLDVGTNNEMLLEDPMYVGLHQRRAVGKDYYDLIDEFMQAVVKRYGQDTLIQFEDFGNSHAFTLLEKYRDSYCTFNDDIQGTAAVIVAGLMVSKYLTGKSLTDYVYVLVGAGQAIIGIANLVVYSLVNEGIPLGEARSKIVMVDIDGLLTTTRKSGNLDGAKKNFAKDCAPIKDLEEIVKKFKPSVLIGASGAANIFTPKILQLMGDLNSKPIIMALSNPTDKAECTAQEAYDNTSGRCIFASGSPFPPVKTRGRTFYPGQGNNAYIFPGVALGIIVTRTHHIPDNMFYIAAKELANCVSKEDLDKGSLYPPLSEIKEVSLRIAIAVITCAYDNGLASELPEPQNKRKWLLEKLYNHNYESAMPVTWPWPRMSTDLEMRPINPASMYDESDDESCNVQPKKQTGRKKTC